MRYNKRRKSLRHALHYAMWIWVSKTGKEKFDWPGWKRDKVVDKAVSFWYCFACGQSCSMCPISWGRNEERVHCNGRGSIYYKYQYSALTKHERANMAIEIARIEWNIR